MCVRAPLVRCLNKRWGLFVRRARYLKRDNWGERAVTYRGCLTEDATHVRRGWKLLTLRSSTARLAVYLCVCVRARVCLGVFVCFNAWVLLGHFLSVCVSSCWVLIVLGLSPWARLRHRALSSTAHTLLLNMCAINAWRMRGCVWINVFKSATAYKHH